MKSVSLIKSICSSSAFLAAAPSTVIIVFLLFLKFPLSYFSELLICISVYFLLLIFTIIVRIIVEKEINRREKREAMNLNLKSIQLQGLKAQLDPHFIFNILNTVASLIYLDDKEKAYDYMIKFTQLLRKIFNDSEDIYRSLSDEMELVNTYLELEKLRFCEKLMYEINIGEGVTQKEQIPKFIVQTFVESSVNYGILPLAGQGMLKINIERDNGYLKLTVEDNGIKRSVSGGIGRTTAQRLSLINEIFGILNQMNDKPIKYNISEINSDGGIYAGTRVEVLVPVPESHSFGL